MIVINKLYVEDKDDYSSLCSDIEYKNKNMTLWYRVDKSFKKYLTPERADCFLCALLLFAVQNKEDIKIIDTPVSSKLLFNIRTNLIPAYSKYWNKKIINIYCNEANEKLICSEHNGTGISRGVDSFATLMEMKDTKYHIDTLTFFNVGSHGDFGGDKSRRLFQKRLEYSKKIALENGYDFISVDSNISEFLNQIFVQTHTYRSISAVFAIQKRFKNYYYSSGYALHEFEFNEIVPAKAELFLLNMLSNDNVNIYSSGALDSRLDKVKKISNYSLAQKYLNVCFNDRNNCNKCEKCIRTIFELYSIGKLELFADVFDINHFYKNINWYEKQFMIYYYQKKQDYIDVYKEMKNNKIKIKKINKFLARLSIIKQFIKRVGNKNA